MAYNTKKMLEDSNGDLIPQYFNQSADQYEHLRGKDGVNFVGNHVLTDSGIWVPQRGTEDGAAHTQLTGSIELHKTQNTMAAQSVLEINLEDLKKAKEIIISIGTNSSSSKYDISAFNTTLGSARFGKTLREVTVDEIAEEFKTTKTTHVAQTKFEVWGNSMKVMIKRVDTGPAPLYGVVMIMGVY